MSNALESRESVSLFVLGERLSRAEFDRYLAELDRRLDGCEPFVMIVDGSNPELSIAELPPRTWQQTRAMAIAKFHRGVAFVTGPMTHERVRALYAMQPPGVPYGFFGDVHEAREWARSALEGHAPARNNRRKTQPLMAIR